MQVVRGGRGEQAGSTQLRQGAQASLEHTGGPGQFIRCQLGGDCGCVALGAIVYPAARDVRQGSQKGGAVCLAAGDGPVPSAHRGEAALHG